MLRYQPVFKYKHEFDEESGEFIYIKVNTKFIGLKGRVHLTSDKQKLQMFNSNDVEELIYTYFKFEKVASDLEMQEDSMIHHFLKLLGQDAQGRCNEMMKQQRQANIATVEFAETEAGFKIMKKNSWNVTSRIWTQEKQC